MNGPRKFKYKLKFAPDNSEFSISYIPSNMSRVSSMKDPKRVSRKKTIMTSPQGVLGEDDSVMRYGTLLTGSTNKKS